MTLLLTFPALITFIAREEINPTKKGTSTTLSHIVWPVQREETALHILVPTAPRKH